MRSVVSTTFLQPGHRHNRLLIVLLVSISMILSISLQSLDFYHATISNSETLSADQNRTIVSKKPIEIRKEDFKLLFGSNSRNEAEKNNSEIPTTKMNLVLRGVLSGIKNKEYESAIIQATNQDKLYEIGDTLPGGAILNQVYSDHVVIKRSNQLEKLYFPNTAGVSSTFQEVTPTLKTAQRSSDKRPGNHSYPDEKPLEQRMHELRERVQEASQEL